MIYLKILFYFHAFYFNKNLLFLNCYLLLSDSKKLNSTGNVCSANSINNSENQLVLYRSTKPCVLSDPFSMNDNICLKRKDIFFKNHFKFDTNLNLREFMICCVVYHCNGKNIKPNFFSGAVNMEKMFNNAIFLKFQLQNWFVKKIQFVDCVKGI